MTNQELKHKIILFQNQTLDALKDKTDINKFKIAYDTAYEILSEAYNRKDTNLFNRIYTDSKRLIAGTNISLEFSKLRDDFDSKTVIFIQELKLYMATNGAGR